MNMVAIGFGVTLTSASMLGAEFPGVVFRPIAGDQDLLPWSAVWASSNKNPALKHLLACARRQSERLASLAPGTGSISRPRGANLQSFVMPALPALLARHQKR